MNHSVIESQKHFEVTFAQLQTQKEQFKQMYFGIISEKTNYLKEHYLPLLVESKLTYSIWQFELFLPLGSINHKEKYFETAFDHLSQLFEKHRDLFVYYRKGDIAQDAEIFEIDSPSLEIYSNIITAQYFEEYLQNRYEGRSFVHSPSSVVLTWTNKQVAFVELAYSLHEAKVFNNGGISLSALINTLAETFHLKLTQDSNRTWQDIKSRKKLQIYF